MHSLLTSYVCDTPETNDLLAANRSITTPSHCPLCLIRKEDLAFHGFGEHRKSSNTEDLMEEMKITENTAMPLLNSLSIYPILPSLSCFPMNTLHPIWTFTEFFNANQCIFSLMVYHRCSRNASVRC